jgi:enoyl-[acyl-carrier protein] reductase I
VENMGFLANKRILITGVISNRSIAYGVAQAMHREGAELAFSYQGERVKKRVVEIAKEFESELVFREALGRGFFDGFNRENFHIAHDISAYSFPAMAKAALPYLNEKSSILTMTYLGAIRTMPHYNVMGMAKASLEASVRYLAMELGQKGIRANGISAGPIKTLAAGGIGNFSDLLAYIAKNAPLKRNVTIEEIGNLAAFMCSDLSSGITGEITYVDGGFNTTALGTTEA